MLDSRSFCDDLNVNYTGQFASATSTCARCLERINSTEMLENTYTSY